MIRILVRLLLIIGWVATLSGSVWAQPSALSPELTELQQASESAVEIARAEWKRFGSRTIDIHDRLVQDGLKESDEGAWQRVGEYWKIGTDLDFTGKDTEAPWSAAFISWLHNEAGFAERFSYSALHATYIRASITARKARQTDATYWGYRLEERAPQVGDLVGYARQGGVSFDYQPSRYFSHTDLVVDVRPGEVDVIGGNVGDSVTLKTLKTDDRGHLIHPTPRWFVVMAPAWNRPAP